MFGSDFFGRFGIPEMQQQFPYQSADAQGGYLAPNASAMSVQTPMSPNDAGAGSPQPIAGQPSPAGAAALGPSSPLSPATLGRTATGSSQPMMPMSEQAPAAGIGTQFAGMR